MLALYGKLPAQQFARRTLQLHFDTLHHRKPKQQGLVRTSHMLPKSQYDNVFPKRMYPTNVVVRNWEVLPLWAVTGFAICILISSVIWAINNKVDVVFSSHNRCNISRTMDLRHPTVHKIFLIKQKYKSGPWKEMALMIEKMHKKELDIARELARGSICKA